jgi:hypothetical protein
LPDGVFSNQKPQFGEILEGIEIFYFRIFYDHSEYITAIGIFYGHLGKSEVILVYLSPFWYIISRKSGNPD